MNSHGQPGDTPGDTVAVWDLPSRIFHWTLAVLVGLAWVSREWGDGGLVWHTWNGYAILILVVWRLLWGFVGSSTSRFVSFFAWPWTAVRYGLDFIIGRPRHFLGHNPLGGSVVLLMLGLVGAQAGLGLFAYDDHTSLTGGPFSGRVADAVWGEATRWHLWLYNVILAVVALHIAANILYLVWKRENLVHAMIVGWKPKRDYEDAPKARLASGWLALGCLVLAAGLVLGGIWVAGGKIP